MPFRDAIREMSGFHRDEVTTSSSSASSSVPNSSSSCSPPRSSGGGRGMMDRMADAGGNFRLRRNEMKLRPEDPYLSFTKEDIDCLRVDWLTDNNISFWEEYLEHEELLKNPNNKVMLLRPSMVFLLKNTKDPLTLKSALPDVKNASHIFLPINDCRNPSIAEGGTHWSLLVVGVSDRVAFHYDSLTPANYDEARVVYRKLEILLGFSLRFSDLEDTPQQDNGSDCGVHVCWAMKHLLVKRLLAVEREKEVQMSLRGKRVDAVGHRKCMLKICESLRKKASRSTSPRTSKHDGKDSHPRIGDDRP
ncbi:cysteine proteinase [Choiromyces venosus 120613-1]|uniref:Cysteine proteinase n=1 Tax=Choiromyces venosus 120613-1 TaxID=1336337 RepID=A0A3N4J9H1_9PEZI|nr:cysteine proteinase [Choiromyces venosus 120613-1]